MERSRQPLLLLWLTVAGAAVTMLGNIAEAVEENTVVWQFSNIYDNTQFIVLCMCILCMIVVHPTGNDQHISDGHSSL